MNHESNPNRAPAAQTLYENWRTDQPDYWNVPPWGKATPAARAEWEARAAEPAPVPASTGRDVDYRILLAKYIEHVYDTEGATFIRKIKEGDVFNKQEAEVLREFDDKDHGWWKLAAREPAPVAREECDCGVGAGGVHADACALDGIAQPVAASELDADAERRAFEHWFFKGGVNFAELNEFGIAQVAWKASAARATAESAPASAAPREAAVARLKAISKASMDLTARLVLHSPITVNGKDYVLRSSVMDAVVDWRNAFDNAPKLAAPSNSPVGAKEQDK